MALVVELRRFVRIGVKIVVKNIEKCFVGSEKGINFALAFGKKITREATTEVIEILATRRK